MAADHGQQKSGTKTYLFIWLALICLTGITIGAARLHFGAYGMAVNLLIASTKAALVIWFFMHLRHESRLLKGMILVPIVTLTIIIGLTFFDIWYR